MDSKQSIILRKLKSSIVKGHNPTHLFPHLFWTVTSSYRLLVSLSAEVTKSPHSLYSCCSLLQYASLRIKKRQYSQDFFPLSSEVTQTLFHRG
jgi:hypothetical protein